MAGLELITDEDAPRDVMMAFTDWDSWEVAELGGEKVLPLVWGQFQEERGFYAAEFPLPQVRGRITGFENLSIDGELFKFMYLDSKIMGVHGFPASATLPMLKKGDEIIANYLEGDVFPLLGFQKLNRFGKVDFQAHRATIDEAMGALYFSQSYR